MSCREQGKTYLLPFFLLVQCIVKLSVTGTYANFSACSGVNVMIDNREYTDIAFLLKTNY